MVFFHWKKRGCVWEFSAERVFTREKTERRDRSASFRGRKLLLLTEQRFTDSVCCKWKWERVLRAEKTPNKSTNARRRKDGTVWCLYCLKTQPSELRMGWLVSSRGNELTFTDREVYSSNSVTDREVYASNTAEQCGRHTRLRIVTSGHCQVRTRIYR